MDTTQVIVLGVLGGFVPDLIRIAKARGDLSQVGGANVLISLVVLGLLGGFASYLSATVQAATVLSSVTAGFAGPEVISRLVGSSQPSGPESFGESRGLFGWWRI